eukprot:12208603-Ditylum_brightwellii.AAC.1
MRRFGWFIDYWMSGGYKRKHDGTIGIDFVNGKETDKCGEQMSDCKPAALFAYEWFTDPDIGASGTKRLASLLEQYEGVTVIQPEARECVHNEVMKRGELFNHRRRGGHTSDVKHFTSRQLNIMRHTMQVLANKYRSTDTQIARDL